MGAFKEIEINVLQDQTVIPYLGFIECGFPSPATEYIENNLNLHDLVVKKPAATYFMRAKGDSMIGLGIYPNDVLVIDRSITPRPNHVVVACIEGEYTLKQLQVMNGIPYLCAANSKYPHIVVRNLDELEIFGVLTFNLHCHI